MHEQDFSQRWQEVEALADRACEGEFTTADQARLETLLLADAALRRAFVAYTRMHMLLECEIGLGPLHQAPMESFVSTAPTAHPNGHSSPGRKPWRSEWTKSTDEQNSPGRKLWGAFDQSRRTARGTHGLPPRASAPAKPTVLRRVIGRINTPIVYSMITAASVLFAGLTLLRILEVSWPAREVARSAIDAPRQVVAARLEAAVDCRWGEETSNLARGDVLFEGKQLVLEAGLAEIMFRNGSRVLLEGPATLTIDQRDAVTLDIGALTAQVPAPARGFEVRTPTCKIVDLGTEFGVRVDISGETEVHCFQGSVETRIEGPQQSVAVLNGGQAVQIRPPSAAVEDTKHPALLRIAYQPNTFMRRLPQSAPQPTIDLASLMHTLRPVAYWRFDNPEHSADVSDESGHGHSGRLIDDAWGSLLHGRKGGALWLGGEGSHVAVEDHPDLQFGTGSFSVAGWIRVSGGGEHALLGKGDSQDGTPVWIVRLDNTGRLRLGVGDSRVEGLTTFETAPGRDLRDGRWHHLAGVFDRQSLEQRYYVDGEQVHIRSLADIPPDYSFDSLLPLMIGRADNKFQTRGFIDDVSLFAWPLQKEHVEQLYHATR